MDSVCRLFSIFITAIFIQACSHHFPRPSSHDNGSTSPDGRKIFDKTFWAHGGARLNQLNDVNIGIDGKWKFLITRIQPLVTDHKYRVVSQERLLPNQGVYASLYHGPAGRKKVFRSKEATRVFYNGKPSDDKDVLTSTALTADSFFIFMLGPLALQAFRDNFIRLANAEENDKIFYRIYAKLSPGIGFSSRDEIVLWIDKKSLLTYRVHVTLEGYKTTQGAHVDVTYLNYITIDNYTFPKAFHERVRGPIAIDAHSWRLTGIDINRNLRWSDLDKNEWSEASRRDATPLTIDSTN